jgi:hypothetical protein
VTRAGEIIERVIGSGPWRIVFTSGGSESDTASYTYAETDNGQVILNISDIKAESIDIDVSAGTKTDDDTEGDLTVSPGSIEKLVKAVMQKGVGLAGARTVPERSGNFLVEGIVRFNWEMTHRLSLVDPRPGEMVAVRDMDVPIPEKLPVDEAFLESVSTAMGRRIVYVPDAVVYNRGPLSVRGYIQQSRRIARGHFQLRSEYGYTVSSLKPLKLMKAFPWGRLLSPVGALLIVYAVSVEILGRLLGFADYHLFRERTGLWPMTHKRRVSLFNGLRNTEESGKPS